MANNYYDLVNQLESAKRCHRALASGLRAHPLQHFREFAKIYQAKQQNLAGWHNKHKTEKFRACYLQMSEHGMTLTNTQILYYLATTILHPYFFTGATTTMLFPLRLCTMVGAYARCSRKKASVASQINVVSQCGGASQRCFSCFNVGVAPGLAPVLSNAGMLHN